MKASPQDQAQLIELGVIDMELVRCAKTLASLPAKQTVIEEQAQLVGARERLRLAQEEVEGFESDVSRAESDVDLVDKRIALDTERLQKTTSPKDAQGLEHELASLTTRRSMLEDVQLELMDKLEQASRVKTEARSVVADIESRLSAATDDVSRQSSDLDTTRSDLAARRHNIVAPLPEDLLALYDRQRERYGQGVSVLMAGVSSASGVQLTESDLQEIRQAPEDDVVLCPDSNAILVRSS